jgi:protein gp37
MAKNSKIAWTTDTLNSLFGCSKVSEGCRNCYAIGQTARLGNNPRLPRKEREACAAAVTRTALGKTKWTGKVEFIRARLEGLEFEKNGQLKFVNSLSDLFHEEVPDDVILEHFQTFEKCPQHSFQVLTKRSKRLACLSPKLPWPDNVWQGVSVEHVKTRYRMEDLAKTGAKIKWVSFEPLLSEEKPLKELWPDLRKQIAACDISWGRGGRRIQ